MPITRQVFILTNFGISIDDIGATVKLINHEKTIFNEISIPIINFNSQLNNMELIQSDLNNEQIINTPNINFDYSVSL